MAPATAEPASSAPASIITRPTPRRARSARTYAHDGLPSAPRGADGRPSWAYVLADLARRGVGRVMIEAGAELAGSAVAGAIVDRIDWFRAPILLGGDGWPAIAGLGLETLDAAPRYRRAWARDCGPDLWERYEREEG